MMTGCVVDVLMDIAVAAGFPVEAIHLKRICGDRVLTMQTSSTAVFQTLRFLKGGGTWT